MHPHTHSHKRTHTHAHAHTHTHMNYLIHTHISAHTRTHARTHARTRAHELPNSRFTDVSNCRLVAQLMVKIHSIDPDEIMKHNHLSGLHISRKPVIFEWLRKWLDYVPDEFSDTEMNKR